MTWKVGDGATILHYTDRDACTVVKVCTPRKILIQEDKHKLLNGFESGEPDALTFTPGGFCGHTSGTQRWEHTPDPDAPVRTVTLRKDGEWRLSGLGNTVVEGRSHFHDYNF